MSELDELIYLIKGLKSEQEINNFFNELFTKSELEAISKRWKILKMLYEKIPQRTIAAKLQVSLCKVTRGSKIIKNKDSIITKFMNKS